MAAKRRATAQSAPAAVPRHDAGAPPSAQLASGKAERSEWEDPADTGRIGTTHVRVVHGFRRADPLVTLHRRSPADVTADYLRAAERLRDDFEIGNGARIAAKGSGGGIGPTEAQLDALARYRRATLALGPSLCGILLPVALDGWTVKDWARARGWKCEQTARGFLIAALARLRDHYDPPVGVSAGRRAA